ncbi:AAA family ATPase [Jiangella asiatica]|uniref:ATP-binding protein n=1 Tax=Jiangella asiatica TaxID=2530372 RepID=A0A4R5CLE2_9ACTN|nr:AAA family ATPase [Jiangella asiatica]TDD98292.1 hypothetical protein E1269_28805 [Jiangella asiatica]
MVRRVVLVSGSPGAGKSTLAVPLADALGFALLSKDTIKETLHDALQPPEGDLASSRRLGAAAMQLLWRLAGSCPDVVLEANFLPGQPDTVERLEALGGTLAEVYCACPPDEAARRYAVRGRSPGHHPVHVEKELPVESLARYDRPVGAGEVITVDTKQPVDVAEVADRVRRALGVR